MSQNNEEVIALNDLALGAMGTVILENYDTSKSEQSPRRDGDKPGKKKASIKPAIANRRYVWRPAWPEGEHLLAGAGVVSE